MILVSKGEGVEQAEGERRGPICVSQQQSNATCKVEE